MRDVAVISVPYVQYSFAYYLDSTRKCGLSKNDMPAVFQAGADLEYRRLTEYCWRPSSVFLYFGAVVVSENSHDVDCAAKHKLKVIIHPAK